MGTGQWFEYLVFVLPQHTDYSGVVWHGTYIAWMEAARVEWLTSQGAPFDEWIAAGIDLPVVDLSIRYRQPLTLGDQALVKVKLLVPKGVRLVCEYDIENAQTGASCVQARVTLAPLDLQTRKIIRRLPPPLQEALQRLST